MSFIRNVTCHAEQLDAFLITDCILMVLFFGFVSQHFCFHLDIFFVVVVVVVVFFKLFYQIKSIRVFTWIHSFSDFIEILINLHSFCLPVPVVFLGDFRIFAVLKCVRFCFLLDWQGWYTTSKQTKYFFLKKKTHIRSKEFGNEKQISMEPKKWPRDSTCATVK